MPPKPARSPREQLRDGPTSHRVILGDSREMPEMPDESVQLVVTSPPYANLKHYEPDNPDQLGDIDDYEKFLDELDKVWAECARVLVPGGRVCCVVGDVNVARSNGGRHHVLPLSADIKVRGRRLGLDHLQGIIWYKVANIKLEASKSSRYLGKPNLPGGVVKNEIASRLIRMFSFVGDTVLDPFAGTGTTALAAMQAGSFSISYEIEPKYIELIRSRLAQGNLSTTPTIDFERRRSIGPAVEV